MSPSRAFTSGRLSHVKTGLRTHAILWVIWRSIRMKSASLAAEIDDDLIRIQDYWQQLRRGENSIPFSDDINLASLPGTAQRTLLIEVFYDPLRFRIDIAGARVEEQYGEALAGRFLDEVAPHAPLEGL